MLGFVRKAMHPHQRADGQCFSADRYVLPSNTKSWQTFSINTQNLGWMVNLRVDGTPYLLQGVIYANYTTARTVGTYLTPTRTIFTIDAGPVRANLTYLTPIEVSQPLAPCSSCNFLTPSYKLNDWARHSLPFAYLAIDLWSTDGSPHAVQVYSDFTGGKLLSTSPPVILYIIVDIEFVSSNSSNRIVWSTIPTSKYIYHKIQQSTIQHFEENNDMSEDGTQYLAFGMVSESVDSFASFSFSSDMPVDWRGYGDMANWYLRTIPLSLCYYGWTG